MVVAGVEGRRYRVAAITTKGEGRGGALLLPAPVASAAGVAPGSSIVVSEFNRFTWPGFDIRPLTKDAG